VPATAATQHDPATYLLVSAAVMAAVFACLWVSRRYGHERARWPRAVLAVVGLPVVFSALCWLLPHVHPEPYEFTWLVVDRALFGMDLAARFRDLPGWLVELLQLDYAAFYGFCIGSGLLARVHSGGAAFDRAVLLLVGGFLSSYLGYLLFPTISPQLVLQPADELRGIAMTPALRGMIDGAEMNHWDCFPSGHTMLTLTSLIILWRWARRWFWWLLAPAVALVASTMLLRYHWASDVVVGALWAWPCARLCDWLATRDGWPRADQRSVMRSPRGR
jgi:membrane-associated phospholipid phosphatase